jgi:beta-mannosidase
VPGEVHTDLMAAGVIPDVFDGANESASAWVGRTDWTYRARFTWEPDGGARQELVAEGLDTIATVTLNGVELGRTANQHRTYRFDVTTALVAGENELVIVFAAPVDAAERRSAELGPRPHVNHHPYNAIRKTASNFGWDWGPDGRDRRHLAADPHRVLERCADRVRAPARHRGR